MTLLADAYLHGLDSFALRLPSWSPIAGIRWYGLAYGAGFVIGWLILRWFAKTRRLPLTTEDVGALIVSMMFGVIIGGRLGYVVFYQPGLLWTFSSDPPWWGLLQINQGGMASHGGVIGVVAAVFWFAWRHARRSSGEQADDSRPSPGPRRRLRTAMLGLMILDVAALACTAGLCLGRIANFVNGELWGNPLPAAQQADPPWWSVKYPEEIITPAFDAKLSTLTPVAEYAGVSPADYQSWLAASSQSAQARDAVRDVRGRLFNAARDEGDRGHDAVRAAIRPHLTAYYPSQLIQATAEGPVLALVLLLVWRRPRRPGVIGGTFLLTYALLRIVTEMFRQPDDQIGYIFGVVSQGQLLSIIMVTMATAALVIVPRRFSERIVGPFTPLD